MHIAVCLSGQPRTWRHTYESLFEFFRPHRVDLFFHTWDETDPSELDALTATYRPRAFEVGPRPLFIEAKRRLAERFPVSPPFPVFDMFHSAAASLRLALQAQPDRPAYDLICRTRFDIVHDGQWRGPPPPADGVLVPAGLSEVDGGCNDQFAIGDPAAMQVYAGVTDWLPEGLASLPGPAFRPEVALRRYLAEVRGLTVLREDLSLNLLREGQIGTPFHHLRDEPMFHARKREDWEAFAKTHELRGAAGELDFSHYGRAPLTLDRWLDARPTDQRRAVLSQAWPSRLVAIDALIRTEIGAEALDAERHSLVRLLCAALIHRMARDEPMDAEGFVVHALSANALDMRRAQQWIQETPDRTAQVIQALSRVPTLDAAFRFAPPFDQPAVMGWRVD
jgi:hypothetical protein